MCWLISWLHPLFVVLYRLLFVQISWHEAPCMNLGECHLKDLHFINIIDGYGVEKQRKKSNDKNKTKTVKGKAGK